MSDTKLKQMHNHQLMYIHLTLYIMEKKSSDSGTHTTSKCVGYELWVKRAGLPKHLETGTMTLSEPPKLSSPFWNSFTQNETYRLYPLIYATYYALMNGCHSATLALGF